MPGHGPVPRGARLCEGAGVVGVRAVGVVALGDAPVPVVPVEAAPLFSVELVLELGAAAAPPRPATAPPAASAPATIGAPSILETFSGDHLARDGREAPLCE